MFPFFLSSLFDLGREVIRDDEEKEDSGDEDQEEDSEASPKPCRRMNGDLRPKSVQSDHYDGNDARRGAAKSASKLNAKVRWLRKIVIVLKIYFILFTKMIQRQRQPRKAKRKAAPRINLPKVRPIFDQVNIGGHTYRSGRELMAKGLQTVAQTFLL